MRFFHGITIPWNFKHVVHIEQHTSRCGKRVLPLAVPYEAKAQQTAKSRENTK